MDVGVDSPSERQAVDDNLPKKKKGGGGLYTVTGEKRGPRLSGICDW